MLYLTCNTICDNDLGMHVLFAVHADMDCLVTPATGLRCFVDPSRIDMLCMCFAQALLARARQLC